jgi:hypothetical protein
MHAYISDRERRADINWFDSQLTPTVGLGQFCQDEFPGGGFQAEDIWHAAALREAHVILAETHPIARLEDSTVELPLAACPAQSEPFLCAIEALAAFVGDPCQCAGGIHWSAERGYWHCNGILPEPS